MLKGAPYNPRKIDKYARKLLRDELQKVGCVEALVWNQTTGNLVSGHQRLDILDELEGGRDYLVGVTVVQVSEKRERELNVFLNNYAAQGRFDEQLLADLLRTSELSLSDVGLTEVDLELRGSGLPMPSRGCSARRKRPRRKKRIRPKRLPPRCGPSRKTKSAAAIWLPKIRKPKGITTSCSASLPAKKKKTGSKASRSHRKPSWSRPIVSAC